LAGGVGFTVVTIAATSAMVLSLARVSVPIEQQESSAQEAVTGGWDDQRARNVIFIQGDGMGIAHRELIRLATKGQNGELAMNQMQYTGRSGGPE